MTEPMSTPDSGGLRAAVEALAEQSASLAAEHFHKGNPTRAGAHAGTATALRAVLAAHPEPVPVSVDEHGGEMSGPVPVLATPTRSYREGTELVAVSAAEWEEAHGAFADVTDLQDALADANAYVGRLPDKIADYLLTHVGGDESEPWQVGHNYAMREAARLVRERLWALDEGDTSGDES